MKGEERMYTKKGRKRKEEEGREKRGRGEEESTEMEMIERRRSCERVLREGDR